MTLFVLQSIGMTLSLMGYDLWLVADFYDTLEFSFPTYDLLLFIYLLTGNARYCSDFILFFGYWFDENVDIEVVLVFVQSVLFFHFN